MKIQAKECAMSHTPTPWAAKGITIYGPDYEHTSEGTGKVTRWRGHFVIGNNWASKEQRAIDARFIVQAVNSHAALIANA